MSIAVFILLFVVTAAVVAYPLLPGLQARRPAPHPAPEIRDVDIERAVRDLRRTRVPRGDLCPACGAGFQPGDLFCVRCGGKLPEPEASSGGQTCPSCGAGLADDDQFCPKCGQRIASGAAT